MIATHSSLQLLGLVSARKFISALITALLFCACAHDLRAAEPLPTPTWLNGKREMLPPVNNVAVDTVKKAKADLPKTTFLVEPEESAIREAIEIYKLGDQAGLAMVWWYAEDLPLEGEEKYANANQKDRILDAIMQDPTLPRWMLPLLRERLTWAENKFQAGKLDQTNFDASELGQMEGYFNLHGTPEDWKRVHRFEHEVAHSNVKIAYAVSKVSVSDLEGELEANEARRRSQKPYMRPFINRFRWVEKYITSPQGTGAMNQTAKGSPAALAQQPAPIKAPSAEPQPDRPSWLVWLLVVLAATVGAVWVFLRKSK